ncbi:hypothetical protein AGLY_015512, partial [Aphis glycines]
YIRVSFDTTAVNSGQIGGTCVLLERHLGKTSLYLPCCHHIFEIVLRSIFDCKMGKSTGKDVLIFKRFQLPWKGNLNKQNSGIAEKDFLKNNLNNAQPRNDYKELLELALIFLGEKPKTLTFFHVPGAIHPKCQRKTALHHICVFLIIIYIEAWLEATSATAAPYNDLVFFKKLYNYQAIDAEISKVAVSKFINHLWYLSPQAMGLAFFDKNINTEMKKKMLTRLDSNNSSNESTKRLKLNNCDMDEFIKNEIDNFVNSETRDFFKLFNLDESFLENDPSTWDNIHSYKNALNIVTKLRVVNDTAKP